MLKLGIDIGGTKIEAAVLDLQGDGSFEVLARERIPTARLEGYEAVLQRCAELLRSLLASTPQKLLFSDLAGIGVGIPGTLDPQTRRMVNGNSAIFKDRDLLADLARLLDWQRPEALRAANDANCFALAETRLGAGRELLLKEPELCSVGIILGTGVGSGLILGGRMLEGRAGAAGEAGHMTLYHDGLACYCGRSGCVEQYLSGPALEGQWAARAYAGVPASVPAREIFALAEAREPLALALVQAYRRKLAQFLSNLTQVLDPHLIVLGGGLSQQPLIYEGLEAAVAALSFSGSSPRIARNQLGDSAGVLGAALL